MNATLDQPDLVLVTYGPEPLAVDLVKPDVWLVKVPKDQPFEARLSRSYERQALDAAKRLPTSNRLTFDRREVVF